MFGFSNLLWPGLAARSLRRPTPRDTEGRFVSAARIKQRAKARDMCAKMGKPVPEVLR